MPLRGGRFRDLRQARGHTQEEIARLLDVNLRMIPRYESGEVDPSSDVLARMAKVLGVTADFLLGLTDDPGSHWQEQEMSAGERRLIMALRAGRLPDVIRLLAGLSGEEKAAEDNPPPPAG